MHWLPKDAALDMHYLIKHVVFWRQFGSESELLSFREAALRGILSGVVVIILLLLTLL